LHVKPASSVEAFARFAFRLLAGDIASRFRRGFECWLASERPLALLVLELMLLLPLT
jgi:hypothetical protein